MPFLSGTMRVAGWDATGLDSCSWTLGIHVSDGFDRSKSAASLQTPPALQKHSEVCWKLEARWTHGSIRENIGILENTTQIVKNECDALDEMYDRGKFENWLFQKILSGGRNWQKWNWMIYNTFDSFSSSYVTPYQNSLTGISCTDESTVLRKKK